MFIKHQSTQKRRQRRDRRQRRERELGTRSRFPALNRVAAVVALLTFSAVAFAGEAVLRPGDTIQLKIGGVPANDTSNVSGAYMIDGDGNVNMPNLGKVRIGGLTAGAAQTAIETEYRGHDIYTHPTIILTMQMQSRWVNVGGEVKSPQRVAYTPDLTVLAAINAAGGFSAFADQRRVRLLRSDQVIMIDVRKVRATPSLDLAVEPGDRIEVPQTIF
jgi:protein involved in polysaccharide export with SLBB domain